MAQTVVGIFKTMSDAQNAEERLVQNGFLESDVDVAPGSSVNSSKSTFGDDSSGSGIGRFFKNLFGDDSDESKRYTTVAERGAVVTVHVTGADEAQNVMALLDQYGAVDVDDDYSQFTEYGSDSASSTEVTKKIPVVEETLNVGKRDLETGSVRVRSRIIERPVEESLRLRQERVHVERRTVDRPATAADLSDFQEGTIEMKEYAEVPVVSKEARIVEEISIGKEVDYRNETISETVRKTEVDIENLESDQRTK